MPLLAPLLPAWFASRMVIADIEGMPEDERLAILEKLDRDNPGMRSAERAAGKLAGAATEDRPDVPIWDYLEYLKSRPDIDRASVIAIRFPVIFFGGEDSTIDSAAEHLRTGPVSSRRSTTFESVVGMWQHLFTAGIVRWNSELLAVEHIEPFDAYKVAVQEWGSAQFSRPD